MNDRVIAGPPEYIAERIRPFIEAGADKVITYFWEADVIAQKECTEAFGKDVIPLLRQIAAAV
jgi:isocitrate lyase